VLFFKLGRARLLLRDVGVPVVEDAGDVAGFMPSGEEVISECNSSAAVSFLVSSVRSESAACQEDVRLRRCAAGCRGSGVPGARSPSGRGDRGILKRKLSSGSSSSDSWRSASISLADLRRDERSQDVECGRVDGKMGLFSVPRRGVDDAERGEEFTLMFGDLLGEGVRRPDEITGLDD
jgi:hypothetical protein